MAFQDVNEMERAGTAAPVVVGLFEDADDAHRAITQLRENRFASKRIGAAFREPSIAGSRSSGTDVLDAPGRVNRPEGESWWERLKDAFRPDDAPRRRLDQDTGIADASYSTDPRLDDTEASYSTEDRRFDDTHEYDFSTPEIEGSFAETGIPVDRVRHLIAGLKRGGAVVTVRDETRIEEAERILSENNGRIRYQDVAQLTFEDDRGTNAAVRETGSPIANERIDQPMAERLQQAVDKSTDPLRDRVDTPGDRVQLFGEVLRAHKERVSPVEVRVTKGVGTENQTNQVPVTREERTMEPTTSTHTQSDNTFEKSELSRTERIELRAYELYLERGSTPGNELEDWLRAEAEIESAVPSVRLAQAEPESAVSSTPQEHVAAD